MGWADSLVSGFSTGYSIAQDARDRQQRRKLADFEIAKRQREADLQKADDDISKSAASIVKNVGAGLDGDGMGPPVAPQDATSVTVAPQPAAAPAEGVAPDGPATPQTAVGLPAGQVGPGQMRPSAIEAAGQTQPPGAAQASAGVQPAKPEALPKVEVTAQKKTEQANIYKTKMRLAEERGLTDLSQKYQKDYVGSLVEQVKADDAQFKLDNKEALNKLASAKTAEELKELQMKAQQRQIQAGGTMLYLWSIGAHDQAREVSKHGALGGEGWSLKEIRPGQNGTLEIVGHDGEVAMTMTPEQARGFVQMSGVAPKPDENVVLADGAKLVNKRTGAPVAENVKDPKAAPDTKLRRQDQVNSRLLQDYGLKSPTGEFIVSPEKKAEYQGVRSLAEQYAADGMDASAAIDKARAEWAKRAKPANAPAAPGAPAVPAGYTPPWKKK